ncbi:DUF6868 family protein [Marinomonas transparens]|uniref:DUF6868 family protein n=1 Tax=Marinomonas transparens TaxID=2795388 RepID=UPI0034DDB69D
MLDINFLTIFLGWCSIINVGVLIFSFLFISVFRNLVINIHSGLMGVKPSELPQLYFHYMSMYKIIIVVFNIVPYFAIKIMT